MNTRRPFQVLAVCGVVLISAAAFGQYTPLWSDEFDGTSLDPNNWECMLGDGTAYGLPDGWGNNEWEYYTARTANVYVGDGALHIVARRENYNGHEYTSARLRTLGLHDFLYGRFEARMKIPSGQGVWPAFWMLPTDSPYGGWAASGEIDLMESINIATRVYGTIHFGGPWPQNVSSGGSFSNGTNFSTDFHVYAFEWEPDAMRWYVDGALYHTETSATWYSTAAPQNDRAPFDVPFHLLLNVAVGGNWPGAPDPAPYPLELVVDWVRVYQLDLGGQSPFHGTPQALPGRIEAEDFDLGAEGVAYHDCDPQNRGGAYRPDTGVDLQACSEGGYNVGWMCGGEWLEYTVDVSRPGPYLIATRVASPTAGGQFHLEFDGVDKTGTLIVPATGGWQNWTTIWARADLASGVQILRFANASAFGEYNLNYFQVYSAADLDRDGDVDAADLLMLCRCLAGPGVTSPPAGCTPEEFARSDIDADGDVDIDDLHVLQAAASE